MYVFYHVRAQDALISILWSPQYWLNLSMNMNLQIIIYKLQEHEFCLMSILTRV